MNKFLETHNLRLSWICGCVCTQSCWTLCNLMDCSPPGSLHGIFQARIPEWIAIPSYRGPSQPRDWTCVSYVSWFGRQIFYQVLHHLGSIRLNHNEIEHLSRLITSKETESVIRNFPTNKSPGPDVFPGKFYQTFKEELKSVLLKFSPHIEQGRILPNTFYEASIILIPKPNNVPYTKNYRPISLITKMQNLQQVLSELNSPIH